MLRIYPGDTPVRMRPTMEALEKQLGITPGRYTKYKSGIIDIKMRDGNNGMKTIHGEIMIEGRPYRVGPTFPRKQRVVTVILSDACEETIKEALEIFAAALGEGATFLAAEPDYDEEGFQTNAERVYLSVDPEKRMRDVVPRMIKVDGEPVYIGWYHAGPFCHRCGKTDHTRDRCRTIPQKPRKPGPIAARKEREAPVAVVQDTTDAEENAATNMVTIPAREQAETVLLAPTERESGGHSPANAGETLASLTVEPPGVETQGTEHAEAEPTAEGATAPHEGAERPACEEDAPIEHPATHAEQENVQNELELAPQEQEGEADSDVPEAGDAAPTDPPGELPELENTCPEKRAERDTISAAMTGEPSSDKLQLSGEEQLRRSARVANKASPVALTSPQPQLI
jgi:hypothetical protein